MLLHKYWTIYNPLDAQEAERETERLHPERETLLLAAVGAARVLGPSHSATKAFAKAATTMDRVDLWRARMAMKTLSKERPAAGPKPSPGWRASLWCPVMGGRTSNPKPVWELPASTDSPITLSNSLFCITIDLI